jgi:hypothetical protein
MPIFEGPVQAVAEALNYAASSVPNALFNFGCQIAAWGSSGNEIATHNLKIQTTSGDVDVYEGHVCVDPDCQVLTWYSTMLIPTVTNTVTAKITIGSASATNTHTNANTGTEQSSTLLTSSTGTGKRAFKIQFNHTIGSAADCSVVSVSAEENTIAATDLPSPGDE